VEEQESISLKELFHSIKAYLKVAWCKKHYILAVGLILGVFGFWKSRVANTQYNANLSFIIAEDESGTGDDGLSAVLGQFGLPGGGSKYNYSKIIEISKSKNLTSLSVSIL